MLQGEHLTLTYQDGETTVDAVRDVSISHRGSSVRRHPGAFGFRQEFALVSPERTAPGDLGRNLPG